MHYFVGVERVIEETIFDLVSNENSEVVDNVVDKVMVLLTANPNVVGNVKIREAPVTEPSHVSVTNKAVVVIVTKNFVEDCG